MSTTKDWFPTNREGQISMAKVWKTIMTAKADAWGIPAAVITELEALIQAADSALATAKNENTRTPVATAQCKTAFEALGAKMRDTKRRYFLTPPLTEADYVSLGLKPHDDTPTPTGTPTAQVRVETYLIGRHELGVKIVYLTGDPADPANKGFRIWYSVLASDAPPPTEPGALRESFFTKRKRDVIEFDFGDSGKTVYFAVQVENGNKKGGWGPLVSALIP